ncbi:unnamed protein product [Menidia menidia]|uniref:(Atlantic silverside) hypothetical protein n=1 Tax=Menidia menidia TaxID=238744 RepID=A0A8S4B9J4_9TELE|nr:unnamed protein product [Menidia menidia]
MGHCEGEPVRDPKLRLAFLEGQGAQAVLVVLEVQGGHLDQCYLVDQFDLGVLNFPRQDNQGYRVVLYHLFDLVAQEVQLVPLVLNALWSLMAFIPGFSYLSSWSLQPSSAWGTRYTSNASFSFGATPSSPFCPGKPRLPGGPLLVILVSLVVLSHRVALSTLILRENQVFLVSLVDQGGPLGQVDLVVHRVLSSLENQVNQVLCLPLGLEFQETQADLFDQLPLEDLAVLVIPDLLFLKSQGVQWDLGDLEDPEVPLALHHRLDQGHLLFLRVQVLRVFPAILAYQLFHFLCSPEDQGALVFLKDLAIPDPEAQLDLVVLVVLLVLGDPEFLAAQWCPFGDLGRHLRKVFSKLSEQWNIFAIGYELNVIFNCFPIPFEKLNWAMWQVFDTLIRYGWFPFRVVVRQVSFQ